MRKPKKGRISLNVLSRGTTQEVIELQTKGRKDCYVVARDNAGWWRIGYKTTRGDVQFGQLSYPPKMRQEALDYAMELTEMLLEHPATVKRVKL